MAAPSSTSRPDPRGPRAEPQCSLVARPIIDVGQGRRTALEARLDALLVGPFGHLAGALSDRPDPVSAPLPEWIRSGAFAAALDRSACRYPGAEPSAVASLWSRSCFAVLIVPALVGGFGLGRAIPLDIDTAPLRISRETGLPTGFRTLSGEGTTMPLSAQLDRLLVEAVAPAIRHLGAATGLSARLLWENAGAHLFWALRLLAETQPDAGGSVRAALEALSWPREACAALTLMRADALAGVESPRRRVCCLAEKLPGGGRCAGICPLDRRPDRTGSIRFRRGHLSEGPE